MKKQDKTMNIESKIENNEKKGLIIEHGNWHLWTTLESVSLRRKYIIAELIDNAYYNHKMYDDLENCIRDMIRLAEGKKALYPNGEGIQPLQYKNRQRGKTK